MTTQPITKVGLIGCGVISATYLKVLKTFPALHVAACADIDLSRAQACAAEFDIPRACTVAELLSDPEIELVVNLTIPTAHSEVSLAVLQAGKHVYSEKPLALHRAEGTQILAAAAARSLRVGCAPDTFLGGGLQTCRKVIDDGLIGRPVAATAFMLKHGHEHWHPDPAFYYQPGGGPMFDMGPYYLTALISLVGPVRRVAGSTQITFPERTITSKPRYGTKIQVNTPTHVVGILDFAAGAIATIVTSFDVWHAEVPYIEIYGSEGTLSLPDPNNFGGPLRLRQAADREWREVDIPYGYTSNSRGLGVVDMAQAIRTGRPHRASGALAYHVLDIMESLHDASRSGQFILLTSTCERPQLLWNGEEGKQPRTTKSNDEV